MRLRARPRITLPRRPLRDGATMLRAWRPDDASALSELGRDPDVVRWIELSAADGLTDAQVYIDGCETSARAGLAALLAVGDADGTPLGSVGLVRIAWEDRRAEIGYWLGASARGHGHATRAVRLACGWGFRELHLERIALLAATGNPASQAVADRAGFRREAILRSWEQGPGGRRDIVAFARLATDPG